MKYGKKYTIDMESLPLYIIAALALIVTPGPDVIFVLPRGIADGRVGGMEASTLAAADPGGLAEELGHDALTVTGVPEPSVSLLVMLGVVLLLRRNKRDPGCCAR